MVGGAATVIGFNLDSMGAPMTISLTNFARCSVRALLLLPKIGFLKAADVRWALLKKEEGDECVVQTPTDEAAWYVEKISYDP